MVAEVQNWSKLGCEVPESQPSISSSLWSYCGHHHHHHQRYHHPCGHIVVTALSVNHFAPITQWLASLKRARLNLSHFFNNFPCNPSWPLYVEKYAKQIQHQFVIESHPAGRRPDHQDHEALQYLVGRPTRWSLLFIFGFLIWSSIFPKSNQQRNIV